MKQILSLFLTMILGIAIGSCSCTTLTPEEKQIIGKNSSGGVMQLITTATQSDSLFLRGISADLTSRDVKSSYYQTLKAGMLATVQDPGNEGVGIAAPQVGIHRRVIAVKRFDKEGYPFEIYPNVYIDYYSPTTQPSIEGCLSIPGMRYMRFRSSEIEIHYTDEKTGAITSEVVRGFTAIIFQHEIDHLEGRLCSDSAKILHNDTPTEIRLRDMGLKDISEIDPSIAIELVYATANNFTGEKLYADMNKAFATAPTAQALNEAQQMLKHLHPGYSLVIYDAARPVSAQKRMWQVVAGTPAASYVANPEKGGLHNYGVAIDLSIIDSNGVPLDMGTPFDHLGIEARIDTEDKMLKNGKLSQKAYDNRRLLREVMTCAGFKTINNEWWHFNFATLENAKNNLELIDI